MYSLKWSPEAWEEYLGLQVSDKKQLKKVNDILKDIQRNGFECSLGKVELLKHEFSGYASVRLDKKNRLIFTIMDDTAVIIQCGGHYND